MTTYSSNALNQRVRKSGPSGSFSYLYDSANNLLGETASGGTGLTTQYLWLQGRLIGIIRNGTLSYVQTDHLGRPEAVTSTTKTIIWRASNFAYDRTVTTDTLGGLNIGFPGQYFDSESGLYYNLNRYYDPATGRYIQSDPIGLQGGINTYAYALNRPTSITDSTGLGPGLAIACTTANGAYQIHSFNNTASSLGQNTELLRDQLKRVNDRIK